MDNEENNLPRQKPVKYSANDSMEVNDLLNISDTDISMDLLAQLESRALEEQKKLEDDDDSIFAQIKPIEIEPPEIELPNIEPQNIEIPVMPEPVKEEETIQPEDIDIQQGFQSVDGSVSVTGEIMERPVIDDEIPKRVNKEAMDLLEEVKMNAVYKKYVIYIDKENEQFIESLSLKERKEVINQVLNYQNKFTIEQRRERKRVERTIKSAIALATFLIAIPIFYYLFNISLEATIQNYKHSKSNFEVLYKESGKIKPIE